jgi:integrase
VRMHDRRYSFATIMLELGGSPKTVQTMLGHSKITTTLGSYSPVSLGMEIHAAGRVNVACVGGSHPPL